jgi:hypothetical protein
LEFLILKSLLFWEKCPIIGVDISHDTIDKSMANERDVEGSHENGT